VSYDLALVRALDVATENTIGATLLIIAGTLLAIILLLAQGGGYIGGAAVAANAARLGRLPSFFNDDRIGISVIWAVSAVLIPVIREVVVVEAYYAFGFVSAFVITSTTVYLVRPDALRERGIEPGSSEAKSLKFAGLRGMMASYFMLAVLVTQKTSALPLIIVTGTIITLFQLYYATNFSRKTDTAPTVNPPGTVKIAYETGAQRAHDEARQRGIADAVLDLIQEGAFAKFNVGPDRITKLVCFLYNLNPMLFEHHDDYHERIGEPSEELQATYVAAYEQRTQVLRRVEDYSHFGIFMFVNNYHINWVDEERGRGAEVVQQAMLNILFPMTESDEIWKEYQAFETQYQPEPIWQFSRQRYVWAKDQWPNLSDRITTIWTLQDFDMLPRDIDVRTVISVADGRQRMSVKISSNPDVSAKALKETMHHEADDVANDDEVADVDGDEAQPDSAE
jgi:hypothetical protein